MQTWWNNFK